MLRLTKTLVDLRGAQNYVVDNTCDSVGALAIRFHRTRWRRANSHSARNCCDRACDQSRARQTRHLVFWQLSFDHGTGQATLEELIIQRRKDGDDKDNKEKVSTY